MDIQMPEMDGIKAAEIIKRKYPQIKIVMLTVHDDDEYIFNAIKNGAPMTPSIALKTLNLLRNPTISKVMENVEKVTLTKRETEILEQLSKGLNYNSIAENLFISLGTVRKHIEHIYNKLHVHNKMEAVLEGKKHNLI